MSARTGWLETHITLHSHDSAREELANGLTHLIGVVAALVGCVFLVRRAETAVEALVMTVFALTMVLLFGASTAYHLSRPASRHKRLFRLLDHLSIFLLIAGTYTPVMTYLGTPWAWWTLGAVWVLALGGMTLKVILWDRFRRRQIVLFLVMGWLAGVRLPYLLSALPRGFFWLLLTGGVSYTVGVVIYSLKRLPYHHAIWHLFVLGGAGSFFGGVYLYL